MLLRSCVSLLMAVCAMAVPATASSIDIGLISYNVVIPAGVAPGVDAINIYDFTGPTYGPFAGDPYVTTSVHLQDVVLTVFFAGGGSEIAFQDSSIPPNGQAYGAQFPSTTEFASAELTATLDVTLLDLSNGSTFTATADVIADLVPSSGGVLQAGVDFAPIEAASAGATTPEPATVVLMSLGILGLAGWRRR